MPVMVILKILKTKVLVAPRVAPFKLLYWFKPRFINRPKSTFVSADAPFEILRTIIMGFRLRPVHKRCQYFFARGVSYTKRIQIPNTLSIPLPFPLWTRPKKWRICYRGSGWLIGCYYTYFLKSNKIYQYSTMMIFESFAIRDNKQGEKLHFAWSSFWMTYEVSHYRKIFICNSWTKRSRFISELEK